MMYKKMFFSLLSSVFIIMCLIAFLISFLDPLHFFSWNHKWNHLQNAIDERLQKTNDLFFNTHPTYEGILIGSSKVTYMNTEDFVRPVFNYSASAMWPIEYGEYIKFFKQRNRGNLKKIYLGLDFNSQKENKIAFPFPSTYIKKTTAPLYRWKSLLNLSILYQYYRQNFCQPQEFPYDRKDARWYFPLKENEKMDPWDFYKSIKSCENHLYDESFKKILIQIKKENSSSEFIVFTNPVTKEILSLIFYHNLQDLYFRWLQEIIDTFGSVVHFMTWNSITEDSLKNVMDLHHAKPSTCKIIILKIQGLTSDPTDFGIILTKENFTSFKSDFLQNAESRKNEITEMMNTYSREITENKEYIKNKALNEFHP
ncbi:MAG: hypothetical protein WCP39_02290 [Chlamydiota bacterium]